MSDEADNPVEAGPTFEQLGLGEAELRAVADAGYARPMPVQTGCYAAVRAGRDVIVQSHTGSGKTAAFVLPVLPRIRYEDAVPQVLVLAPTRELAMQVHGEMERLARYTPLRSVNIYGGTGYRQQLDRLRDGVHAVVGTPGRILDHWRRGTLKLEGVRILILDEADEMLSAGFLDDIRKVIGAVRAMEQVLLFSATLPPNLERLVAKSMHDPVRVDLSGKRMSVDRIENLGYPVDGDGPRYRTLVAVLETEDPACAIIFCNTKSDTESVTSYLKRRGYDADLLNSNLGQGAREAVMARMKAGEQRLLVATDIAARGIDISFLPCVINYEPPLDPELYLHRTGRTGRVDRSGRAITLMSGRDVHTMRKIEGMYGVKVRMMETPSRKETLQMLADRRIRELKERIEAGAVIPDEFKAIATEMLSDPDAETLVAMLVDRYLSLPPRPEAQPAPQPPRAPASDDFPGPKRSGGRRRGGGGRRR